MNGKFVYDNWHSYYLDHPLAPYILTVLMIISAMHILFTIGTIMNYYFMRDKIFGINEPLDPTLYDYEQLTTEQSNFYEDNLTATIEEIRLARLAVPYQPTLAEAKLNKIVYFSELAFELRLQILPEYKLINASLGIYDEAETLAITTIVNEFRTEYYRLKALVEACSTVEEVGLIQANY